MIPFPPSPLYNGMIHTTLGIAEQLQSLEQKQDEIHGIQLKFDSVVSDLVSTASTVGIVSHYLSVPLIHLIYCCHCKK
jgi:hypothetical protein